MLHDKTGLLCEPSAAAFAHTFARLANTSPCAPDRRATSARTDGILHASFNMKFATTQHSAVRAPGRPELVRLCVRAMAVNISCGCRAEVSEWRKRGRERVAAEFTLEAPPRSTTTT